MKIPGQPAALASARPTTPVEPGGPPEPGSRGWWLGAALVVLAGWAAYHNSLRGPFIYDDVPSISENPSIRHLGDLGRVLGAVGRGATVQGRPVLNLTLALNHALGGLDPRGYHAVNLLIHIVAGLALYGLVRRTLLQPRLAGGFGSGATALAAAAAVLWTVHPLQTEAVTYVIQRAESLMGMFFLLTVYAFVRGTGSARPRRWWAASFGFCLLGSGTKEVAALAPVLVLLYDRTFVAGSLREAWRARGRIHAALASTWLVVAGLVLSTGGNRGGTIGVGTGANWGDYVLTQAGAITHYLRLCVWPSPLVLEYGPCWVRDPMSVLPQILLVLGLAGATLLALRRAPVLGFLGCWFFGILAPTSLVPGTTQLIVEHRMYLPLAAVVVLAVAAAWRWAGRASLILWAVAALALGYATVLRNDDYRSAEAIWTDALAHRPDDALALLNLGYALADEPGRTAEAIARYEQALRLDPHSAEAHYDLGIALAGLPGRTQEAIAHFRAALEARPDYVQAHNNLGLALASVPGRLPEAIDEYRRALRLDPECMEAHCNLGTALFNADRLPEAVREFEAALRLDPDSAQLHLNLAIALLNSPAGAQAGLAHLREALRLQPDLEDARQILRQVEQSGGELPGQPRP